MADAVSGLTKQATDTASNTLNTATDTAGQLTKTATDTAGSATKKTPLRGDFERKADALQRRGGPRYFPVDSDEDSDSDPEFVMPARHGKHRIVPVRTSRIADRPVSDKDSTMRIKIELDLEVEVEIYARVKGDVTIGLL